MTVIQIVPAHTRQQGQDKQQQQQHRELPKTATNGALAAATTNRHHSKRKLPEHQHHHQQQQQEHQAAAAPEPKPRPHFRSNLPRPSFPQGGRGVPLPPVPELDRSDHERESMSPVPEQLAGR